MTIHKNLSKGKWQDLNLTEQMANIGSEVARIINWKKRNKKNAKLSFIRTLELMNMTLKDKKNKSRLKEVARAKEVLADWYFVNPSYKITDTQLKKYFLQFAKAARKER